MPAMAGDWPRDPRAYGSPPHTEPSAVRTLPSVAELLSSRPSANSTGPVYHQQQGYFHARSTPPATSIAATTTATTTTTNTAAAASYWNSVNHHPTSPPVSPTEQRPPPVASAPRAPAVRVYQEPTFRRQQTTKADPALHYSALSSGVHDASHSTAQVRQDSAIDQHRFEADNDTQLSKSNVSYSHQSPKDSKAQPSPRPDSLHSASSASAYASIAGSHQVGIPSNQAGAHLPARQHSKSLSSGAHYLAALPQSHEPGTERPIARNDVEPRTNITGPSSLPEQFFTQQNNFGTRQHRYNVRFAANYTSENMSLSQKPRNESPTPPTVSSAATEPEQPRSSPVPVPTSEAAPAPSTTSNGNTRHVDTQSRTTRDPRDRSDREPSVERCLGCNEAWRRPIPDMGQEHLAPAENNADYMRLASNMIDRLRDHGKKADAAYEEWKWRHSRCHRPGSPHSIGSVDEVARRPDPLPQHDGPANSHTINKRKSDAPHEPQSASKQRRVTTSTSPAPLDRKPKSP